MPKIDPRGVLRSSPGAPRTPRAFAALVVAAALAAAPAHAAAQADTLRWTVLIAGRDAGGQEAWTDADGARRVHYHFEDRQRGADLLQRAVPGPGGIPVSLATTGNDYLKNPVDETFARDGARAAWKTAAGAGERTLAGPAFYVSTDAVPDELARLVRALLAAPDRRLALLPVGTAELETRPEWVLPLRDDTARLYLVSGLRFTPVPVWVDGAGELFAQATAYGFLVREGAEGLAARLLAAQDAALAERRAALARTLAHDPAGPLVLRNATVFDAAAGQLRPGQAVVVRDGRIAWVGPDAAVREPAGSERIDLGGKVLIPGLWDMHVHFRDEDNGLFHLAAGVTTVRDMGTVRPLMRAVRRRIDADSAVGPRVLAAGMLDGPGQFVGPTDVVVSTPAQAVAAVDTFAALGYRQIKVYSSVDTSLVRVIARRAHEHGLRVSGHVPQSMIAEQAVRAGFDEVNHLNYLFLDLWGDSVGDTRTMVRVTAVGDRAAGVDLSSAPVRRLVRLLRRRHTVVDPTLNVFERIYLGRKGVPYPGYEEVAARVPPQTRIEFVLGGLPADEEKRALYRRSFERMMELAKRLRDARVTLVAGSDGQPGFAFPRELELWVQAGIPPAEVLRTATLGAARVMGMERDFGTVSAGKVADLVVLGGDPLQRIGDVRRVELVIKGGRVYHGDALRRAMGLTEPGTAADPQPPR